jgi:hypothetical protein
MTNMDSTVNFTKTERVRFSMVPKASSAALEDARTFRMKPNALGVVILGGFSLFATLAPAAACWCGC